MVGSLTEYRNPSKSANLLTFSSLFISKVIVGYNMLLNFEGWSALYLIFMLENKCYRRRKTNVILVSIPFIFFVSSQNSIIERMVGSRPFNGENVINLNIIYIYIVINIFVYVQWIWLRQLLQQQNYWHQDESNSFYKNNWNHKKNMFQKINVLPKNHILH